MARQPFPCVRVERLKRGYGGVSRPGNGCLALRASCPVLARGGLRGPVRPAIPGGAGQPPALQGKWPSRHRGTKLVRTNRITAGILPNRKHEYSSRKEEFGFEVFIANNYGNGVYSAFFAFSRGFDAWLTKENSNHDKWGIKTFKIVHKVNANRLHHVRTVIRTRVPLDGVMSLVRTVCR